MSAQWQVFALAAVALLFTLAVMHRGWQRDRLQLGSLNADWFRCPRWLLLWRFVLAAYFTAVLIFSLVNKLRDGPPDATGQRLGQFVSFFTQWNFMLCTVYFWMSGVCSWRLPSSVRNIGWGDKGHVLCVVVWVVFQVELTCATMLDIVVWTYLYPEEQKHVVAHGGHNKYLKFGSLHMHGFNLLALLVEFAGNRLPLLTSHLCFTLCWCLSYLACAWVYFALTHQWKYSFLDWDSYPVWKVLVHYAGLLGCLVFVNTVLRLLQTACKGKPTPAPSIGLTETLMPGAYVGI